MSAKASPFDLSGRRALVTGSSRGLGLAIARALGEAGASLILNARDSVALGAAAADLAAEGLAVSAVAFDVTSRDSIDDAIAHIEGEIGPIDILVNNAGMQFRAALDAFPPEKFDQVIQTNVTSVFNVSQAVAQHMIGRRSGKIINICSLMSALSRPSIAPYAASKAAVANLTRGMAVDWAKHGLNINGIAPGYFATELNAALLAEVQHLDRNAHADGPLGATRGTGRCRRVPRLRGRSLRQRTHSLCRRRLHCDRLIRWATRESSGHCRRRSSARPRGRKSHRGRFRSCRCRHDCHGR
jgi:gluconate 5-dehydrogenase